MDLRIVASLSFLAVVLAVSSGCGGRAYVGDLDAEEGKADGGGTPIPSLDGSTPTPNDGGVPVPEDGSVPPGPDSGVPGFPAPGCYPGPRCPPGLGLSPAADAKCAPGVNCVSLPPSECSANGGACAQNDGISIVDPCTSQGYPIGYGFKCNGTVEPGFTCCMPKPSP